MTMRLGRLPSLDGFRAISIIWVLQSHCRLTKNYYIPFEEAIGSYEKLFFWGGGPGVEMFFVISGFLITTLLIREETNTGEASLQNRSQFAVVFESCRYTLLYPGDVCLR